MLVSPREQLSIDDRVARSCFVLGSSSLAYSLHGEQANPRLGGFNGQDKASFACCQRAHQNRPSMGALEG
jgi:hypothetical protein